MFQTVFDFELVHVCGSTAFTAFRHLASRLFLRLRLRCSYQGLGIFLSVGVSITYRLSVFLECLSIIVSHLEAHSIELRQKTVTHTKKVKET